MSASRMRPLLFGGHQRVAGLSRRFFPSVVQIYRQFWCRSQEAAKQEPRCMYQGSSHFNEVVTVLEIPPNPVEAHYEQLAGARVLLLDRVGNVHSVYHPDRVLTSSYWDVLATLPSLVPPGPLGLLGLGAGTIPRIIGAHYPCQKSRDGIAIENNQENGLFVVHGWELDPGVVMASRLYLGMDELERSGVLVSHTDDALSPSASIPGGFTGIIVDLFAEGRLLPQLTKRSTWECIRNRLATDCEGTRVLANLGQSPPAVPGRRWQTEAYTTLRAYEAMEAAFRGEVSLLTVESNTLALSGPLPAPDQWPGQLPAGLRHLEVQAGMWARDVYPLQNAAVSLSLW